LVSFHSVVLKKNILKTFPIIQSNRGHSSHLGCRASSLNKIWKRTIQGVLHPNLVQFDLVGFEEIKAKGLCEYSHHLVSGIFRLLAFHILISFSKPTRSNWTKFGCNTPWMVLFQILFSELALHPRWLLWPLKDTGQIPQIKFDLYFINVIPKY
jgi:hypothetical protein